MSNTICVDQIIPHFADRVRFESLHVPNATSGTYLLNVGSARAIATEGILTTETGQSITTTSAAVVFPAGSDATTAAYVTKIGSLVMVTLDSFTITLGTSTEASLTAPAVIGTFTTESILTHTMAPIWINSVAHTGAYVLNSSTISIYHAETTGSAYTAFPAAGVIRTPPITWKYYIPEI